VFELMSRNFAAGGVEHHEPGAGRPLVQGSDASRRHLEPIVIDMKITRNDLQWAASQGVITPRQADDVWTLLERHLGKQVELAGAPAREASHGPRFDAAHVAYYFGALLVIGAMGWFMTSALRPLAAAQCARSRPAMRSVFGSWGGRSGIARASSSRVACCSPWPSA
jgi:hypothetical protein